MGDTGRRILLRTRWVLLVVTAMLSGAVGGALLAPAPLGAVAREIIELQRDVALLLQAQRDLQRSEDEKHAVLKTRSEEHTSELQSRLHLVCRLLLEKKKNNN